MTLFEAAISNEETDVWPPETPAMALQMCKKTNTAGSFWNEDKYSTWHIQRLVNIWKLMVSKQQENFAAMDCFCQMQFRYPPRIREDGANCDADSFNLLSTRQKVEVYPTDPVRNGASRVIQVIMDIKLNWHHRARMHSGCRRSSIIQAPACTSHQSASGRTCWTQRSFNLRVSCE
jgi:hypothetical protein